MVVPARAGGDGETVTASAAKAVPKLAVGGEAVMAAMVAAEEAFAIVAGPMIRTMMTNAREKRIVCVIEFPR